MRSTMRIEPYPSGNDLQAASVSCSCVHHMVKGKGFTLIELMAVIAVAGILATIAIPAYKDWMTHSAVNNAAATVLSKLKQARNTAVAENRDITVSFDLPNLILTYDVYAYAPKVPQVIDLGQFSNRLLVRKNRAPSIVFTSLGTIQGQVTTMKVVQGNYYQCIIVNLIGRAYMKNVDNNPGATCVAL